MRVALFAALAVAACARVGQGAVIDGWPLGEPYDCGPRVGDCSKLQNAAVQALDLRDPGHAPVVSVQLFEEGPVRNERGQFVPIARSGGPMSVAVIQLADGSVRAIGVRMWFQGVPMTLDWGPEQR